jgi:hypothetical protein
MPYPYPFGYSTNFCMPGPTGGCIGGPPIQVMSADQLPGGRYCNDKKMKKNRKHRKSCSSESSDTDGSSSDESEAEACDPLTDEKYSLTDIVKIIKKVKSGQEDCAAKIVAAKLKGKHKCWKESQEGC